MRILIDSVEHAKPRSDPRAAPHRLRPWLAGTEPPRLSPASSQVKDLFASVVPSGTKTELLGIKEHGTAGNAKECSSPEERAEPETKVSVVDRHQQRMLQREPEYSRGPTSCSRSERVPSTVANNQTPVHSSILILFLTLYIYKQERLGLGRENGRLDGPPGSLDEQRTYQEELRTGLPPQHGHQLRQTNSLPRKK